MTEMTKDQLNELFASWRHDGLMPLVLITGWADLLQQKALGPLSGEQQNAVDTIQRAVNRAMTLWNNTMVFLRLQLGNEQLSFKAVSLIETLNDFASFLQVQTVIPDDLPEAWCDAWYVRLAVECCMINWYSTYTYHSDLSHMVTVWQVNDSTVVIQVVTKWLPESAKHRPDLRANHVDLSLAELIIGRHGSQLEINATEHEVIVQFTLGLNAK